MVIVTSVMKSNANNTISAYAIVLYDLLGTMQRMHWNMFALITIFTIFITILSYLMLKITFQSKSDFSPSGG